MAVKTSEVPKGNNFVQFYADLYRSYLRRSQPLRAREADNWGMYSGVDGAQWSPEQLQQLIEEKRPAHQINFTQQKVNDLLGNALQNETDTEFLPGRDLPNDTTLDLNALFLADKNRGGWSKAERLLTRAGLVMRGSYEMYIDYRTDPQGSIGRRYLNHDRIIFDPDWDTDNINDNKHIIQFAWMDPEEIKLVYNKSTPEIEAAIEFWRQAVATRDNDWDDYLKFQTMYADVPEFVDMLNQRFLVIQVSRLERVPTDRLFDLEKQEFLPDMSPENQTAMMQLRGKHLRVMKGKTGICKVATVAPGLSMHLRLEDGNHPVQIGRYPIFTWSYMNVNGIPHGVVDVIKDPQKIYNKRESAFTHWQTTASNGTEFVEEDFFVNDTVYNKYVNEKNIPGGTYKVKNGTISTGRSGIGTRPRDQIPNDLHTSADRAFNMVPEISPVTPALSGGEGKSGESGVLNRQKRAQALITIEPMMRGLEELDEQWGEAYFLLAKNLYSGAPRAVKDPVSGKTQFLNIPTQDGRIINNIANLPRHSIIISKSKRGVSVREELLNRYVELLPFFQNPILRSRVEMMAITVLPNMPDSEVKSALNDAKKFLELQNTRVGAETSQNMVGIATFQKQLQQLSAAPQPGGGLPNAEGPSEPGKTPAEGGGFSVEGKDIKPGATIPADVRTINQMNK